MRRTLAWLLVSGHCWFSGTSGFPATLARVLLGLLFAAVPTLVTLFVVQNTTAEDYGPSFAAATLSFGIAQTIAPPIGGFIADQSGIYVFLLSGAVSLIGMVASLGLPQTSAQ